MQIERKQLNDTECLLFFAKPLSIVGTFIATQTIPSSIELLQNILKPFEFNESHQTIYGNYCSICADIFSEGTKVIRLACHHIFHDNCIWKWCEEKILHPTCPNCNEEILNKKVHRGKEELLLIENISF